MLYNLVSSLSRRTKSALFAVFDCLAVFASLAGALALLLPTGETASTFLSTLWLSSLLAAVGLVLSHRFGLPYMQLNSYESRGVAKSALLVGILGCVGLGLNIIAVAGLPVGVFFVFSLLLACTTIFGRMLMRQITLWVYRRNEGHLRVLVYGAGQTGQQLVAALRTDDKVMPVAFVDDNPTLQSTTILGLRVHAPTVIKDLVADKRIDRVVLAMPSLSQPRQARIAHALSEMGCEVHVLPSFAELVSSGDMGKRSVPVTLDQYLGRNRLESELPGVSHAYRGRRILVTGAGGSIGSELCRQLIAAEPECVVLFDHSELALYNIEKELSDIAPRVQCVPVLGSVCDTMLVKRVLEQHKVQVVLHAAAYKHLPLVQTNPIAGLQNNVIGTKTLADASREAGVERFILVSSDKAVRPTNVMGASKRLAEMVVQDLATRSTSTMFSMVRFGNVLGSSGSVIPLFEEQIARGGPVTLTHGAVTRYFMTISEAARLVLLAGSFARGGDVFVLDMGDPVPIKRLAEQMIAAAGYTVRDRNNPHGDIELRITGLRPGEKLHEELLISSDMLTTPHTKILRAQEGFLSEIEMATAMKDLRKAIDAGDEAAAKAVIERWVEHGQVPEPAGAVQLAARPADR